MFVRNWRIVFAEVKFTDESGLDLAFAGTAIVHVTNAQVTVESRDLLVSALIVAL
jgi:hypothetical protein